MGWITIELKNMNNTGLKTKNKGFTLAEMLIVVAIIAVLVAGAVPVFTALLERSRESADLANVRSAYAEVMAAAISEDEEAAYEGNKIRQDDGTTYLAVIALGQKKDGWDISTDKLTLGGISYEDDNWVNEPKANGSATVTYDALTGTVTIDWGGEGKTPSKTVYDISDFGTVTNGTWNGSGSARVTNTGSSYYHSRRSTGTLVELDANSSYTLTYTVPADYEGNPVNIGTLLFSASDGRTSISGETINDTAQKADSGWITSTANYSGNAARNYQTYTVNADGSITVTQTINTDDDNVYFGANFRVSPNKVTGEDGKTVDEEISLTENEAALDAVTAAMNSLTLTKN